MPTLSARELASQQAEAEKYLDKTCVIKRNTPGSDGMGGQVEHWDTISTVSCSMAPPTGSMMQQFALALGELATWVVDLPSNTDVQRNDRLVIGSDTLVVQHSFAPESLSVLNSVLATEIR